MEKYHIIAHHGVKGQRWGVRRFQNKDGSLTLMGRRRAKKQEKEEAAKAKQKAQEEREKETTEQRRARILKSTNAKELYENRNLLTTQELNERLSRIDTERRLGEVAAKSQKSKLDKFSDRVDKIVKVGTKVNDVYKLTQTDAFKGIKKLLSGEEAPKGVDINKTMKNLDKMSPGQIKDFTNYMNNRASIKKNFDKLMGVDNKDSKDKTADQLEDLMRRLEELENSK